MADKTVDEREMRKIRRDQIREENQQRAQEEDRRKAMAEALANLQRQRELYLKVLRAGKEEQLPIREVESRETEVSYHDSQEKPQEQPLHELTAHSANRNEQERNTLQASERGHADRGSSTYSVTDYEQTYKTIDNVSKFRQSEMRETSASRESNSPAGIMHSTPKEDKYASLDQDILELDRMLASLKETRNKSYEKGKREPQLASSSQTEIKLISREEMDQKSYDQLEPSSSQAPVRKKLTFYEPCIESRTVDRDSQVKRMDSRQHPDTNQDIFRDKEEPQQSIEAREKLARLEAYQRDLEQQYNQIIYRGAESSGKSHTIETSEQLGYMRIPQLTAHLQPRDEVTQINQYVSDKQIPQKYKLDPMPTSMDNKDKENVVTTELYKQPCAEGISDLRTGLQEKARVTSKNTVSQKEIPIPQDRVSQEMYRNGIRYDQNELGYHEKKYAYRVPEYIGPNQYIKQESDLNQKERGHYQGQMIDSVIPSRLVEVVYEIEGQKYVTLCPDNSRQYRVEKEAPMHRYANPPTLSEVEQRDSKDVASQFHDQRIKVGYCDQFGELKLDNRTRGGEFSNRQSGALGLRKQHADPYAGSYEIRDKGESLQCFIDQEVRERRKKRENNILTLEDEIKKKAMEIKAKEEWVKSQDELRKRIEIVDPIEEELKVKEHILKEKLRILNEKEIELSRRESNHKTLGINQTNEDNKRSSTNILTKSKANAIGAELDEETKTILTSNYTEKEAKSVDLPKATEIIGTSYEGSNSFPKITSFSGEEPKPKSEATYEEWIYEVECIQKDSIYSEQIIAQAVRKSLKGPAKRVLLPLGPSVSIKDMLSRLEGVFGNVATGESILQEFYTASQKADESVTAWGLRIEEILQKAVIKGNVKDSDTNEMLKNIFWKNLRNDRLKNATRAKFESIQSFDLLRRAVRAEEYDMKMNKNSVQPPQIKQEQDHENKQEETSLIKQLLSRISELEKQMKDSSDRRQPSNPSQNKDNKKTEKKDSKTSKYHSEN